MHMRAPLRSCADPTVRAAAPRPCFRRGHPPALVSRGLARGLTCPCYASTAGPLSTAASESVFPSPSRASPCTLDAPAACPTQHHQHHTHTSPRFTLSFRACPRAWLRLRRCKWWSSGLGKREARNGEPSGTGNKEKRRRAAGTTPSSGSVVWGKWARVGVMALLARAGGPGDDAWRWVS